jgi:hypothetical protein
MVAGHGASVAEEVKHSKKWYIVSNAAVALREETV